MTKKIREHIGYYLSLVAILAFGLLLVLLVYPNRSLQAVIVVLTALSYVFWGIVHHLINHDLHAKIVVEYTLVGILGLTIVLLIL